jgi:alkylhydroperoxidase family enzyme
VAGKRAGLSLEKINAAPDFTSPLFDDKEKAVVRFANEVTKDVSAIDESIGQLRNYFDDSQIAELTMVIGVFNVLTRFADTFKVDLEF